MTGVCKQFVTMAQKILFTEKVFDFKNKIEEKASKN